MVSSTTASQAELNKHQIPLQWRDNCSALLIPLNVCRHKELYLPWKCEDEKHVYENYIRRMKKLAKQKKAAAEELEG